MKQEGMTSKLITGYHKDELIETDGCHFENAILENCIITYSGGDVTWNNMQIKHCTFRFLGDALKTIKFLKGFQGAFEGKGIESEINLMDLPIPNEFKN